jgi:DNA integrity scanning protein DisA with diadenylate cyclase activity
MCKNALEAGMSFSTFIRRASLEGSVVARLSEADRDLYLGLVQLSNDVHRLVVLAREQGVEQALATLEAGRNALDQLLNRLQVC